jgi:hypothetical protein
LFTARIVKDDDGPCHVIFDTKTEAEITGEIPDYHYMTTSAQACYAHDPINSLKEVIPCRVFCFWTDSSWVPCTEVSTLPVWYPNTADPFSQNAGAAIGGPFFYLNSLFAWRLCLTGGAGDIITRQA